MPTRLALIPHARAALVALGLALVSLAVGAPPAAHADIVVDVNQGQITPLPIAISPFAGPQGADIAKVIAADLERSGYFRPLDPATFTETNLDVGVNPHAQAWRAINAQALVYGGATVDANGLLNVSFRLWDVFNDKQLAGIAFKATPENWRRVAHKIADKVYEKLTGQGGYFDSRLVVVAESGPRGHRIKRLLKMDQDGFNPVYITTGGGVEHYQVLTPRFSPSGQEIAYMALGDSFTRIYVFNLETGREEALGPYQGQVFAPRFAPDGLHLAFSLEKGGNTDIYVADLRNPRALKRLTYEPSIDTSPSYSPDGGSIVFNSDRSGTPELYVMTPDGGGVHRISRGSGRYNTPVWSPTGEWIAFTKQEGGRFSIGVMRPDGSEEHILSTSYFEEGPTWAPNGRYIMFHREAPGVEPTLWTVDVTGRIEKQAPVQSAASDPTWSPLLP
jgi:TolB protein